MIKEFYHLYEIRDSFINPVYIGISTSLEETVEWVKNGRDIEVERCGNDHKWIQPARSFKRFSLEKTKPIP